MWVYIVTSYCLNAFCQICIIVDIEENKDLKYGYMYNIYLLTKFISIFSIYLVNSSNNHVQVIA